MKNNSIPKASTLVLNPENYSPNDLRAIDDLQRAVLQLALKSTTIKIVEQDEEFTIDIYSRADTNLPVHTILTGNNANEIPAYTDSTGAIKEFATNEEPLFNENFDTSQANILEVKENIAISLATTYTQSRQPANPDLVNWSYIKDYVDNNGGGGEAPNNDNVYPILKALLVAGTNMTITPNDVAKTLTFISSGSNDEPLFNQYFNHGEEAVLELKPGSILSLGTNFSEQEPPSNSALANWEFIKDYVDKSHYETMKTVIIGGTDIAIGTDDDQKEITINYTGSGGATPTPEEIYPIIKPMIAAGNNITITPNDTGRVLTLAATLQLTRQAVYEQVELILQNVNNVITWTKNDTLYELTPSITFPAPSKSQINDLLNAGDNNADGILQAGNGITLTKDGTNNTTTIAATGSSSGIVGMSLTGNFSNADKTVVFPIATVISEFNKLRITGEPEFQNPGGLAAFLKSNTKTIIASVAEITVVEGSNTFSYSGIKLDYLRSNETNPGTNQGSYALMGDFQKSNQAVFVIDSTNPAANAVLTFINDSGANLDWNTGTTLTIEFRRFIGALTK